MWSSHVNSIVKASYGILQTLKTIKRFTPFKVRKFLAESLVPSRLNYSNAVFGQLTKYLQNRSQLVQKSAVCYVIGHNYGYAINLNWLPLHESIQYNTVKCIYHGVKNKINFEKKARQFYQDKALARALSK